VCDSFDASWSSAVLHYSQLFPQSFAPRKSIPLLCCGSSKPGHDHAVAQAVQPRGGFVRTSHSEVVMLVLRRIRLRPPAARSAFDKMAVVEQTVEYGGDRGAVAE
jgi:hypothetical protein